MTLVEKVGVKDACKLLNIKYQTAKSIVRRFKQTGKAERKNKILKNSEILKTPMCNQCKIIHGMFYYDKEIQTSDQAEDEVKIFEKDNVFDNNQAC